MAGHHGWLTMEVKVSEVMLNFHVMTLKKSEEAPDAILFQYQPQPGKYIIESLLQILETNY
jgi:hypothetical protein